MKKKKKYISVAILFLMSILVATFSAGCHHDRHMHHDDHDRKPHHEHHDHEHQEHHHEK